MNYIKHIMVLSIIVLLTGLVFCYNPPSIEAAADSKNEFLPGKKYYRVYFDKLDTAHKIVISMNAIESKYEEGYVIVTVTTREEYRQLLDTGLTIVEIADPGPDKIAAMREAALYQSEGIPAYPCYRTVEETFAAAESIAANFPTLTAWTDIGDSWEKENGFGGFDMKVLKLTNSAVVCPKPRIFITSAIHGREYTTAELVTRLAEYLVDNYGSDADVTWMLDYREIHMLLHANPDGRKKAETGLEWRKNTNRSYCSPTSNYRGADLNRNYSFKWACCDGSSDNECRNDYHGAYAASEPEIRAIQDYILALFPDHRGSADSDPADIDTTGVYLDIHSSGRLVMWSWGWTPDPAPNAVQLQTFGRKMAYFNKHTPEQSNSGLKTTDGTSIDFVYGELGIPAFVIELGTAWFEDCAYFENNIVPDNIPAILYAVKAAGNPYKTPAGPDAVNPSFNNGCTPAIVPVGTVVKLKASIDDTRCNNSSGEEPAQNIAAAEYYVDVPPFVTGPLPAAAAMSPSDGYFDNTVEDAEAVIDTTGWVEGRHIIFVRGRDAKGNWGAFSAVFLYINNAADRNPPTPNPMTWAALPHFTGSNSIAMTASTACDPCGVEYYFDCLTPGGHDSGWQDSPTYVDKVSVTEISYEYRVKARDRSPLHNETAWSTSKRNNLIRDHDSSKNHLLE